MGDTRRRLAVPVTFITAGTPAPVDTSAQTLRRRWRVTAAWVDAFELAGMMRPFVAGLSLGPVAGSAESRV
ncbi:MAG: hypothetical protein M1482_07480, partial [Chloroflexi bacterium]|nr:hypothetical protein [Chloroflexota bacterium]